ncbi:hypothetical protein BC939DRAFT_515570 [Gamsiella multidivaricata]|uniref:uncharacterized protein n=1 Tax=Gamsiella multidivaricata TaxID=101098 RepID=UPI00221E6E29|nr:uncharacterized protein BC939DRAFT_515570 [Gamsiella multidivaricata]KAI7824643.1 hypothetical protein BC939DRAFT_515570 [Gamsiella multidivaricata]
MALTLNRFSTSMECPRIDGPQNTAAMSEEQMRGPSSNECPKVDSLVRADPDRFELSSAAIAYKRAAAEEYHCLHYACTRSLSSLFFPAVTITYSCLVLGAASSTSVAAIDAATDAAIGTAIGAGCVSAYASAGVSGRVQKRLE